MKFAIEIFFILIAFISLWRGAALIDQKKYGEATASLGFFLYLTITLATKP